MNRILLSLGLVATVLLLSACQTVTVRHHTPSIYVVAEHPVHQHHTVLQPRVLHQHQHQHQQIIVQQTQIQQTQVQHTAPAQLRHGIAPAPARAPVRDPAHTRTHTPTPKPAPTPANRPVNRAETGPGRPVQGKPTTPPQRAHPSRQISERQTGPSTATRATPATPGRGPTQTTQPASPSPRASQPHPRQAVQQQSPANTGSRGTAFTQRGQAVAATAGEEERINPRRAR